MNKRFSRPGVIAALIVAAAMMLTGCNASVDQIAQSLEIMAENAEKYRVTTQDNGGGTETAQEPGADEKAEIEKNGDIYILFTSDVHCGIDQGFGYAGLKQIRDTLENAGYETILVDDGDAVQGEPIGTVTKGEAIIPIMNALGYDVAIPGNHEFDYGMDEFFKYTEMADFPYISCNFNKEGKLVFKPYIIKEAAGKKIAFVGITTPETMTDVSPKTFMDDNGNYIYGFLEGSGTELYEAVQSAVDDARAESADLVYVMAHMGNYLYMKPYDYMDIIANTTGIDVFLDGHSHDTEQVVMLNKAGEEVTRSACGTKLNCIGYSHIEADGDIETGIWTWDNEESIPYLFDIENDVASVIKDAQAGLDEKLSEVVAKTDVDLTINDPELKDSEGLPLRIVRFEETNLGDLCADAARVRTGADIGFVNGGGIRADIEKGDITYSDIINVHPFGNNTVVIEVSGQQIADALEWSCRALPEEEGGFLQVSGISFTIDANVDSGCEQDENGLMTGIKGKRRVSDIKVGDEPIDPGKTYTVAGNSFLLLNNGNGYSAFDGAKIIAENAGLDNQLLIDYIVETLGGTVGEDYADPYGQGRIVIND